MYMYVHVKYLCLTTKAKLRMPRYEWNAKAKESLRVKAEKGGDVPV